MNIGYLIDDGPLATKKLPGMLTIFSSLQENIEVGSLSQSLCQSIRQL